MKLATKKYWRKYNTELWRWLAGLSNLDKKVPLRVQRNPYGLYETPKEYDEDGIAYNDGTWKVYNTCRVSSGRLRRKIHCKNKDELIKHIYGYIIFLYYCGIPKEETLIYVVRFIIYKLTFNEGMFDCSKESKNLLKEKILGIYNSDVKHYYCYREDDRRYAVNPIYLRNRNKSDKTKLHNQIEGQLTYKRLEKNYDPNLSIRKNVERLNKKGIQISKSTIARWLQHKKEEEEKKRKTIEMFGQAIGANPRSVPFDLNFNFPRI